MVPDLGVNGVGEIDRGGAAGKAFHLALGGEHENFVLEKIQPH